MLGSLLSSATTSAIGRSLADLTVQIGLVTILSLSLHCGDVVANWLRIDRQAYSL